MGLFGLLNEEQDKFIPQLIAQAKKTNDLIIILEKFVNGNIVVESEKTDLLGHSLENLYLFRHIQNVLRRFY